MIFFFGDTKTFMVLWNSNPIIRVFNLSFLVRRSVSSWVGIFLSKSWVRLLNVFP